MKNDDHRAFDRFLEVYQFSNWFDINNVTVPSSFNLEKEMIKKDLFWKLSKEAKQIVDLLFNADDDILNMLRTPIERRITRKSLMIYLQEIGVPLKTIVKSFKELKQLVSNL